MPKAFLLAFELLHDDVVVLAGFDVGAVLADRFPQLLEALGVRLLHVLERCDLLGADFHEQLMEAVARAGGRGRAQHLDLHVRQRHVDIGPVLVGVGDELAVLVGNLLGKSQEHLLHRQLDGRAGLGLGDRQPVDADLDLDDVLDAVLLAILELALLHRPRGVGKVGMGLADAGAEQLHAAARAGRLHDRRLAGARSCRTARPLPS